MRLIAAIVLSTACCGAADITVGQWNGMLLVTAPAGHDLSRLGSHLNQRITLDARDQPLTETAEFLRRATGLNIVVAPALIASPPTVTMQVREMALGNVLSWVERVAGIHIGVVSGALFLSDQPVVGAAATRLYDVSDLTMPIRDFPGPELSLTQTGSSGATIAQSIGDEQGTTRYDLEQLSDMLRRQLGATP